MKIRQTNALHHGRCSVSGSRYFITICAHVTELTLLNDSIATLIRHAWISIHATGDATIACATIMPNHVHMLLTLGDRLSLGRVMAKFKTLTREALRQCACSWQRDYFERRLRVPDPMNPFARYIFMNPYRAGLLDRAQEWPYWFKGGEPDFAFLEGLKDGRFPPDVWFDEPEWDEPPIPGI